MPARHLCRVQLTPDALGWIAFLAGALVVLATSVGIASADPATVLVRSIEISGIRSVEADTIKSRLAFAAGQRLTPEGVDRSIRQLFESGLFSDVRIKADKTGGVLVTIVESPRVASIAFEGNVAVESSKLQAAIALKKGGIYSRARARADEIKLRDLYRREGRYRATVASKESETREGVAITFTIAEGDVNKVVAITFTGHRAFSDGQLRDVITTTQSGWLDLIKTNVAYDPERLTIDRMLLLRHYQTHGFADAGVGEPKVEDDPATNGFRISFPIEEGERFTFSETTFEGALAGGAGPTIKALVTTRAGDTFNPVRIEASADAIGAHLATVGQPFVRVSPRLVRDKQTKSIGVVFKLEEGPHTYIRRIEISGNSRTRDYVIRRELRLAEGDAYSPRTIEASRKRLLGTGFFKSVEIKPAKTAEADRVDLNVAVVEQETGELSFGIGYSLNDGVIGDASYADRNVLGTGLAMRVKVEAGQTRYGAEVGFTDPHFLDSNVAAGFDLFHRDVDRTVQSSYKQQRYGGTLRAGIPLTDNVTTSVNYTFTHNRLYDVGDAASAAIREAAQAGGGYTTSSIGYSTSYDSRDNRKMPTSGFVATAAQDFAGVGGDSKFIRSVAEVRGYYPVVDGVTLVGRAAGGTISGYGGQEVRLLDLFFKGPDTVRGFASGGIGPRDGFSANQDALGGASFYSTSAELRMPIPFATAATGLSAMVFADAGSLFGATTAAKNLPGLSGNSAAPRASTGVGLVWDSPVGPLQASYAFVLNKQPGDKTQPFNFGLGSGF